MARRAIERIGGMNREAQKRGVPDTAKPQPVLSTWPTPQTTVRAILYAISARGVNALNDLATSGALDPLR